MFAVAPDQSLPRAINFGEFVNNKPQQPLPKCLISHEAELGRFMGLCRKTCDRILTLLALGLEVSFLDALSIKSRTHISGEENGNRTNRLNTSLWITIKRSHQTGPPPASTHPKAHQGAPSGFST